MTQRQQNRSCSLGESAKSVNVIEAAMTCSLAIVEKFCNENTAKYSFAVNSTVQKGTVAKPRPTQHSRGILRANFPHNASPCQLHEMMY